MPSPADVVNKIRSATAPIRNSIRPAVKSVATAVGPLLEPLRPVIDKCTGTYNKCISKLGDLTSGLRDRDFAEWQVYTAMLGVALLDVLLVTFTRVKGEMMVERHPIITNALQGAVLVFAGDTIAQMYENRQKGLTTLRPNMSRLRKAALVGVVNVGLWPYYWYLLVDTVLPNSAPPGLTFPAWAFEWSLLSLKIVLDSAINGFASILTSFSMWSMLSDETPEAWQAKLKARFFDTWAMDWRLWPLYNVLCFTVTPLRLRPLTSGIASMLWNGYLSHQSQSLPP